MSIYFEVLTVLLTAVVAVLIACISALKRRVDSFHSMNREDIAHNLTRIYALEEDTTKMGYKFRGLPARIDDIGLSLGTLARALGGEIKPAIPIGKFYFARYEDEFNTSKGPAS